MKRTLSLAAGLALGAVTALILLYPVPVKSDADPGPTQEELTAAHATLLADAIEATEGRCTPGLSGERGCFQYLPGTWAAYSKQVAGKVLPQTAENERYVTEAIIRGWIEKGVSDRGVLLLWNQGSATGWGPGTKDCYAGTNKWGVHYDSCAYAMKGLEYLKKVQEG